MSMLPTTLDWDVVQGRLAQYPRLAAVFAPWTSKGRRLGDHSIVLEWLNDGSPGCFARVASVESDLDTVAAAGLPGLGLAARLGREGRDGTFGILAELFVGAWYLRSGVAVIDVHRDHGQGDVIIRDGDAVAHVEVYELSAPNNEYVWRDAWAELADRLKSMRLPCTVVVWGPPNVRWEQGPGHPYPVPVPVDPPDLTDIQAICRRVGETAPRLRPLRLQGSALSRKYPELWIELKDGPSYVIATGGWSGGSYSPSWVADRILAKVRPVAEGRAILVVEVSRFPIGTFISEWERAELAKTIAARVKSWDAVIAFTRAWTSPRTDQVHVLYERGDTADLLPTADAMSPSSSHHIESSPS